MITLMAEEGRPRLIKLIRDDMGRSLADGGRVVYRPIDDSELHVQLLRAKLIEEALEYLRTPEVEELADVLEVVDALTKLDLGVSMEDIVAAAVTKRLERGGFEKGIGMFITTTAPRGD